MYHICKRLYFDSSHRLWDENMADEENKRIFDKCANFPNHGHTYTCEIKLKSNILTNGMVVNFSDVKKKTKEILLNDFDHHFINNLMEGKLSTAENIAKLFFDKIKIYFPQLYAIRIWEGRNSWAEWQETPSSSAYYSGE